MLDTFKNRQRHPRGNQLIKYAIALVVILSLTAVFFPQLFGCNDCGRRNLGKIAFMRLSAIEAALNVYANDFGVYPPNPNSESNSGQILRLYLTQKLDEKGKAYGPYLQPDTNVLVSPLRGQYEYRTLTSDKDNKPRYVLIDPGADQKLGGYIDPKKGWVRTGPEADDNIFAGDFDPKQNQP